MNENITFKIERLKISKLVKTKIQKMTFKLKVRYLYDKVRGANIIYIYM